MGHIPVESAAAIRSRPTLGVTISETVKAGAMVTGLLLNKVSNLKHSRGTPIVPVNVEIMFSSCNGHTTTDEDLWTLETAWPELAQTVLLRVGSKPLKVGIHVVVVRAEYGETDANHDRRVQINVLPKEMKVPGRGGAR